MADEPKQYVPFTPPRNEQEREAQKLIDRLNAEILLGGRPPTRYSGSFPDDAIRHLLDGDRPPPPRRPGHMAPSRPPKRPDGPTS
jgi:hypothetical protein